MKFFLLILMIASLCSCTTFSEYSKDTKTVKCDNDKRYVCFANEALHWNYTSFGGVYTATDKKEFNKLKVKNAPKFKNVLLYGQSWVFQAEYYILLNNKKNSGDYILKDTLINGNKITIAVSRKIKHKSNISFLLNGFN